MSERISKPPSAKQLKNEQALIIYAAFLIGLILLVVAAHQLESSRDGRQVKDRSFDIRPVLLRYEASDLYIVINICCTKFKGLQKVQQADAMDMAWPAIFRAHPSGSNFYCRQHHTLYYYPRFTKDKSLCL